TGGMAWWSYYTDIYAFSALNWRALGGGDLTFAHELGHNFGCAHDRANSDSAPFFYAWGYHFNANGTQYGTIMSSIDQVTPYSPNPDTTYLGQPTGLPLSAPDPAAANAFVIRDTRWTLANFRDAGRITDCNGNGIDDAIDIANGTSTDLNGNC